MDTCYDHDQVFQEDVGCPVCNLRKRIAELEGALKKYGEHDFECRRHEFADSTECDCGLRAALEWE